MKNKILLTILSLIISTSVSFAKKPPTMPISYDATVVSARSFALAQTGVAMPGDIGGVTLNPASLGYVTSEKIQAEVMIGIIRDSNLSKNEISFIDPIDLGLQSFVVLQQQGALSWRTLSSNEIKISDGENFYKKHERIKAITISAANKTDSGSSIGLNISYLYGTISESSLTDNEPFAQSSYGNGFTIDIGYMKNLNKTIFFGINLENILGFMWWDEYDYDQIPFGIRTGLGYSLGTFNLLADYCKKFYRFGEYDDDLVSVGLEQYISNVFCVRLGAAGKDLSKKDEIKYTYGFGLNISVLSFNVAGESYKTDDENISKYVFSLKVLI